MSGSPTRFTNGMTQDQSTQPFGQIGIPDPFFYAYYEDDFTPYNSALYTATLDSGTAAQTTANGAGGRILLTTAAASSAFVGLQLTSAFVALTQGFKVFYGTRIRLAAIATTSFTAGLVQTTATPATITDGIYFSYTANATSIVVNVVTGSTVIGTTTVAIAPVNATDLDLAFVMARSGDVLIYIGTGLFGNKTLQYGDSSVGGSFNPGPMGRIPFSSLTGSLTTALLNPTLAIFTSNTSAQTLVADFQAAGMER